MNKPIGLVELCRNPRFHSIVSFNRVLFVLFKQQASLTNICNSKKLNKMLISTKGKFIENKIDSLKCFLSLDFQFFRNQLVDLLMTLLKYLTSIV